VRTHCGADHEDRVLFGPPDDPVLVDVPGLDFAMIDGSDDPATSPDYQQAVTALYAFSYPVVIAMKRAGHHDLKLHPLEGLWWGDSAAGGGTAVDRTADDARAGDRGAFELGGDRTAWRWTMMMRRPDDIPDDVLAKAQAKVVAKVGPRGAAALRIERFDEGRCAQVMHHGPYAGERLTIERLHAFIADGGLRPRGRHHEIYLSDPRLTLPTAMRTILRQPVTG
jgi:hypothetical protein